MFNVESLFEIWNLKLSSSFSIILWFQFHLCFPSFPFFALFFFFCVFLQYLFLSVAPNIFEKSKKNFNFFFGSDDFKNLYCSFNHYFWAHLSITFGRYRVIACSSILCITCYVSNTHKVNEMTWKTVKT